MKTLILDLNGVLIKGPKLTDRLRNDFGVQEVESLAALNEVMGRVRLPNADDVYSYWRPYLQKWGINLSRDEFLNYWFREENEISEMASLVRDLKKKGVRVFILSNNFRERTAYYDRRFPFLREISDKIYYSWETGFKKNNPEAYKKLLTENNLKSEECIFFDDSEENIRVAKGLGIQAFLFQDAADLKTKVSS